MATPTLVMATWRDGLFVLSDRAIRQEFAETAVSGLARDGRGGVLAIVGGRTLFRGADDRDWHAMASSAVDLACCVVVGELVYAGTDEARILRIDAAGRCEPMEGFDAVAGREKWYAGAALVNGKLMGPPLGIRTMAATCDAAVLLANVHVGGIPRSIDGGKTWQPTIDIDVDVHQVCAHPTRPDLVIAAAAAGLCTSRDAGATWTVEQVSVEAPYCSAVAFAGDEILVAASAEHFAPRGAIYHRPIDRNGSLQPLGGGLPRWLSGICDTGCIDVKDAAIALADRAGNVYLSPDLGRTWSHRETGRQNPTGLVIL